MAEKEMQSADVCTHKNKIKTSFAKIFVSGTPDMPYFNILYFDPAGQDYHIGFSSYCLECVFKWLSEEFEIEDAPAADVVPVAHGRWVEGKCSNCGADIPTDDAHDAIFETECRFCYYCGAKMDGGADNEAD